MKGKHVIYWKLFFCALSVAIILYLKLAWLLLILLLFAIFTALYIYTSKSIPFPYLQKVFKTISFFGFVFIIAAGIKILVIDIFVVPSNSMEELFFSGDIILVNKLKYGPKLPGSPFDIPWINILFYFNDKAKSRIGEEWWPSYRLSGYDSVHHEDVIVYQFDDLFVTKRCVALPGDTIAMVDGRVFINKQLYRDSSTVKNDFVVEVNNDHRFYWKMNSLKICCIVRQDTVPHRFIGNFSYKSLNIIKTLTEVKGIRVLTDSYNINNRIFVNSSAKRWTLDNMGPLIVPKKGMELCLTQENFKIYERILREFENIKLYEKGGEFFINLKKVSSYVFTQNYYFVLGDNRKNSDDSRINGFVPERKIIGKILGILYSSHSSGI